MSGASLTPEAAFAERWLDVVAEVAPDMGAADGDETQFIGDVPLLMADDETELEHGFATLVAASGRTLDTNSGYRLTTAEWTLEIHHRELAAAERIAEAASQEFDRQSDTWASGNILAYIYRGFTRRQEPDGVWVIAQSWTVRYDQTNPAAAVN